MISYVKGEGKKSHAFHSNKFKKKYILTFSEKNIYIRRKKESFYHSINYRLLRFSDKG